MAAVYQVTGNPNYNWNAYHPYQSPNGYAYGNQHHGDMTSYSSPIHHSQSNHHQTYHPYLYGHQQHHNTKSHNNNHSTNQPPTSPEQTINYPYVYVPPSNNNATVPIPISPSLTDSNGSDPLESNYHSPNLPMKRLFPDEPSYEAFAEKHDLIIEPLIDDQIDEDENDSTAEEDEDDLEGDGSAMEQLKQYLKPLANDICRTKYHHTILTLINECLTEQIPVKVLLSKLKLLCMTYNMEMVFNTLLQTFVKVDGDTRMVKYLKESGVEEQDLEFVKELELTSISTEIITKKRERKRESISKGIRSPPNKWSKEESQLLIKLVTENGDKQWKKIAAKLGRGKTGAQCAQHWKRVLSPEIKKGSWDEEEEELLFQLVATHGQSWKNVAADIKTRTDIQCRYQYYKASMSRQTPWTQVEIDILTKKIRQMVVNEEHIAFQTVSKHLARAKSTKIPRTALECKTKWNELVSSGCVAHLAPFYPTYSASQRV